MCTKKLLLPLLALIHMCTHKNFSLLSRSKHIKTHTHTHTHTHKLSRFKKKNCVLVDKFSEEFFSPLKQTSLFFHVTDFNALLPLFIDDFFWFTFWFLFLGLALARENPKLDLNIHNNLTHFSLDFTNQHNISPWNECDRETTNRTNSCNECWYASTYVDTDKILLVQEEFYRLIHTHTHSLSNALKERPSK